MKDSYLSCFHEVDLTEEKWFWNHRREVCVAYAIGYSQLVRGMCDIQLDAWKQWFSFILCVLQTSFSTGRTAALSTSRGVQRVRPWSEEGVLVLLYTPPQLFLSLLAAAWHCCCCCSPYRKASSAWEMLFLGFFQALFYEQDGRKGEI